MRKTGIKHSPYKTPRIVFAGNTVVYTDWCCKWNPWIWWWWFVVLKNWIRDFELFGWSDKTTNNRMELKAIIETLIYCEYNHIESPIIVTDSKFCISVCTAWLWLWIKENRIDEMKNPDLSHELIPLLNSVKPKFEWVKWHSWDEWNEYADMLSNKYTIKQWNSDSFSTISSRRSLVSS